MGTWITHLRVAEKFKDRFDEESFNWFLIGNIAPDAGVVDNEHKTYHPSTEISHYRNRTLPGRWKTRNLEFYHEHVVPASDKNEAAFKLGYFIHLFLDELWGFYLYKPLKAKYRKEVEEDRQYFWDKKENWAYADFHFLENNREWEVWNRFAPLIYDKDWLDFYPASAINNKLNSLRDYYNHDKRQRVEESLMSIERVNKFISLSHFWISRGLALINAGIGQEYQTVMALMEASFNSFKTDFDDSENLERDFMQFMEYRFEN